MGDTPAEEEDFHGIEVFISSVSSSTETKKHQQKILMTLQGKKLDIRVRDISSNAPFKDKMREICGQGSLPPQIANDGVYCGDYGAFEDAVEEETLDAFLHPAKN